MGDDLDRLLSRIEALPSDWHGVGSVGPGTLRPIARHAQSLGPIHHSVETRIALREGPPHRRETNSRGAHIAKWLEAAGSPHP